MTEDSQYYQNKIDECEIKISKLETQMERAGVDSKGDYQNKIDKENENIEFYKQKIEKCEKLKTPDQIRIFFYVIVSTKEKVKQHVGPEIFNHFDGDRYHDLDHAEWKPFQNQKPIKDLLLSIESDYGVKPIYLDGEIDNEHWINIDNEIDNTIAVIDLFSIDTTNQPIALKFDTQKAGVLVPLCRSLHDNLYTFAKSIEDKFKVLKAVTNKPIPCELYASELSAVNSFNQQLLRIFNKKFPIKNQSSTPSAVRELKINLQ